MSDEGDYPVHDSDADPIYEYSDNDNCSRDTSSSDGPSSRLNKWYPTDRDEVYRFLGILKWMRLDKKPSLSDYWRKSDLYLSNAAKFMSRDRFEIILRMFHFSDNELCPEGDRLYNRVERKTLL
ncbi:hypothetical protein CBL_02998 [Carabus blaptoides fortunei]